MNTVKTPRRLSVSSWSLHRTLGAPDFFGVGQEIPLDSHNRGTSTLLELPQKLAAMGINTMEICHFHLLSRDDDYLHQLRSALEKANVELWSFLIDDGDISHPQNSERDVQWVREWFPVAQKLGAKRARVIGGKSEPTPENMQRSMQAMQQLAQDAKAYDLRLMTENWYNILSTPQRVLDVFEQTQGEVGLCLDFGNWNHADKHEMLSQIAPLAESCHAKFEFVDENTMDLEDGTRCLDILRSANFSGAFTLINGTPGDEWRGLEMEKEVVQRYL
ncbi:MAG TPA: TIM barrel protein [Abditibacteriaceae bacterium]|jgi:sugar phosphate isomerase/epimerase|nr:TIM barrel protein [Abditibacteriaceae bacterium]